ncbi:MAG: hypothetical protein WC785_05650 [Tatlockia sp.]
MAFTLALLGTDTSYLPDNNETALAAGYAKAETISYILSLVKGNNQYTYIPSADNKEEKPPLVKYSNSKAAVVDGPDTMGSEVGDRIARGVQAVLKAISEGETQINIIAHSRGAVEAILVAQEVERIQKLCAKGDLDPNAWANSDDKKKNTGAYMKSLNIFAGIDPEKVQKNIANVKISMLNIDPVPGGSFRGLKMVAWKDDRFYKLPEIVKNYEQYVYNNEVSRCFKPIVPKCDNPTETNFKLMKIPGHHGTGSGNLKSQNPADDLSAIKDYDTGHVQELMVLKAIDFLQQNGTKFTPRAVDEAQSPADIEKQDPFFHLVREILPAAEGNVFDFDKLKADDIYIKTYDEILKNRKGYEHFNNTSYAVLGREWDTSDRQIHNESPSNTFLNNVVPTVFNSQFLNQEHARLFVTKNLGLDSTAPKPQLIRDAGQKLLALCKSRDISEELISFEFGDSMGSLVLEKDPVRLKGDVLLDTKEGRDLLLQSLGLIIAEITQSYLQGQFKDEQEQTDVYNAITEMFTSFNEYLANNKNDKTTEVVQDHLNKLNESVMATLDTKLANLEKQCEQFTEKLTQKVFLTPLAGSLPQTIEELKNNGALQESDQQIINLLLPLAEYAKSMSKNADFLETSRNVLKRTLAQLSTFPESELRNQAYVQIELALEESFDYDITNIRRESIELSEKLTSFKNEFPHFEPLVKNWDFEGNNSKLIKINGNLLQSVTQYVQKKGDEPIHDEVPLQVANMDNQIRNEPPELPKINSLLERNEALEQALRNMKDKHEADVEKIVTGRDEEVNQLNTKLRQLKTNLSSKEKKIGDLEERIKNVNQRDEVQYENVVNEQPKQVEQLSENIIINESTELLTKNLAKAHQEINFLKEQLAQAHSIRIIPAPQQAQENIREEEFENEEEQPLNSAPAQHEADHQAPPGAPAEIDEVEKRCNATIERDLEPLTKKYLIHLFNKVHPEQKINRKIDGEELLKKINDYYGTPPEGTDPKLVAKYNLVSNLYKTLIEANTELPHSSQRIDQFYKDFGDAQKNITAQHRDDKGWKWFKRQTTNVAITLSVGLGLLAGVVPGLAMIATVAAVHKTPKYWESKGQTFFNKTREFEPAKPALDQDNTEDASHKKEGPR